MATNRPPLLCLVMPGATFTHAIVVPHPPADVWRALQVPATWEGIGPIDRVWDAEHRTDGTLDAYRWSAEAAGRRWEGTARTTEAIEGRRLSLRLKSSKIRGSIATDLASTDGGTTALSVTMKAEAVGMLATLFWGVIQKAIGGELPHQVEDFAARLGKAG